MSLKISDKDKKLLLILLIVVIIAGGAKLFDVLSTAVSENESELRKLNDRYSELVIKNSRKATYVDDTELAKTEYRNMLNRYNNGLSQEHTLIFLGMVEKETGVWLKQVGFTEQSAVYTFGNVKSTNPATSGQKVYSSDYVGISTTMTLAYECTYDKLKEVLKYLRENGKKATISNISFTYAQTTDIVSGTMQMTLYAITGADREFPDAVISDVAVGTDNIFSSDTFMPSGTDGTYRDQIINNYDLYMIMNQPGSDLSTVAVGVAGDPNNETVAKTDNEGVTDVTLTVTGKDNQYKVSYKVGSSAYPVENFNEGATLVTGESLDMLIISKPRVDGDDKTLANVTIVNETDMALNVAVINDDEETPRVNIEKTVGTVIIFDEQ